MSDQFNFCGKSEICLKHGLYLSIELGAWMGMAYLSYYGCAVNWSVSSNCFTYSTWSQQLL
jgi:hypothetical protein